MPSYLPSRSRPTLVFLAVFGLVLVSGCAKVVSTPSVVPPIWDPARPNEIVIRHDYEAVISIRKVASRCRANEPETTISVLQNRIGRVAPIVHGQPRWLGKKIAADDIAKINSTLQFFRLVTDIRVRCGPDIETGQGALRISGFPNASAQERFGPNEVGVNILFNNGSLTQVSVMNLPADFLEPAN